jgi:hypothetical protein
MFTSWTTKPRSSGLRRLSPWAARPHDQDGDAKLRTNAMKVILHDFQNGSDDQFDGFQVDDSDKLCDILDQLHRREPFILELEGGNGFRLAVGIGGPASCIQHSSKDGEPPYMVAVLKDAWQRPGAGDRVFLCGGQPTEIRGSHCVPYSVLRSVASYFLQTGDRSMEVDWVEV